MNRYLYPTYQRPAFLSEEPAIGRVYQLVNDPNIVITLCKKTYYNDDKGSLWKVVGFENGFMSEESLKSHYRRIA